MGRKKAKQRKRSKGKTEISLPEDDPYMYLGYDPEKAPANVGVWNAEGTDWLNHYGTWYGWHGAPRPKGH